MKTMNNILQFSALTLGLFLVSFPAAAACTDPPAQEVNWQRCNMDGLNFDGVDLTSGRLRDTSFIRGSMNNANLQNVSAFRTKFVSTSLIETNFTKASLPEADFTKADLTGVNFTEANLGRARLYKAMLRGANLTKAKLKGADLTKADLSGATWVDGKKICAEGSVGRCK
ncbi:pentapeptide repeat-containing protein [Kiloniella antarctica]|uniref:Pentapeptide repeat-containing protein n=1 Tax=Kiloniella antarctica TaxID=1550907 RepID=A0ABW5BLK0_9PROT